MKHNLGKVLLLILSLTLLQAEDFSYTFHVDKSQPYVKEAVILTLEVTQTNHDIVLLFDFDLKKSHSYTFQRIGTEEVDAYHAVQIRYTYLVYPLLPGEIDIDFTLTQKATTDDSVAYSFSGDRDNVKGLVTKNSNISLPSLTLAVKPLPRGTQLVGDFSLDYTIPKHQAKAYEPLPFKVTLKGDGYPPLLTTLIPKDVNFTVFTEQPHIKSQEDTNGTHSTFTYTIALSHSKNFTLSGLAIKAFNPKTKNSYILTVPSQNFYITEVTKDALLDKVDSPTILTNDLSWVKTLLAYFFVFVAGFFTAWTLRWGKKSTRESQHPLTTKIQKTKDTKALLQLLMAHENPKFSTLIAKLENSLYGDGKITFTKVKQEAQDLL